MADSPVEARYTVPKASMDKAVDDYLQMHWKATEARLSELQAELPDVTFPYQVSLPQQDIQVAIPRLVCFTDARFVNAQSMIEAQDAYRAGKRKRSMSPDQTSTSELETAGMPLLAALMSSAAPSQLRLTQLIELAAAGAFCNAGALLMLIPDYVRPLMDSACMLKVVPTLRKVTRLLASDALLTPMLDQLHWMIGARLIDTLQTSTEVRAKAQLQACLSRSVDAIEADCVREYLIGSLSRDPPCHGLLHAAIATILCNGDCAQDSWRAIANGVQPAADGDNFEWMRRAIVPAVAQTACARLCVCREGLLQRLVNGPWKEILARPSGSSFMLAAAHVAPQRRWVMVARLNTDQSGSECREVRCRLQTEAVIAEDGPIEGMRLVVQQSPRCWYRAAHEPCARTVRMQDGMLRNTSHAMVKLASAAHAWVHEPPTQRSKLGIGLSTARSDIPTYSFVSKVEKASFVDGQAGLAAFAEPSGLGYESWEGVWYFVAVEEDADDE